MNKGVNKMFLDKKEEANNKKEKSLLQRMKEETPIEVSEAVDKRTRQEAEKVRNIVGDMDIDLPYSGVPIERLKIWLSIDSFKGGFEEIEEQLEYLRELCERKLNDTNLNNKEQTHYRERYDLFILKDEIAGMVGSRRKQVFDRHLKKDGTKPIIGVN